jgi:hypothetical protein
MIHDQQKRYNSALLWGKSQIGVSAIVIDYSTDTSTESAQVGSSPG